MSFYKLNSDDIINTTIRCHPRFVSQLNGNAVTGSILLERQFLNTNLANRIFYGFSQKEGGFIAKTGSLSASIDFVPVISGSTNTNFWHSVTNCLYPYYRLIDNNYQPNYTGSLSTTLRIIDIPAVYYDKEILTGSFTASDKDTAGADRFIYDNGRGGLYSGSLTGTLVGNIFYQEGLAVLTKGDLSNFGADSSTNFLWKIELNGVQNIPVKIIKCRKPAGDCNVTTNPTFSVTAVSGAYKNMKEVVSSSLLPYITEVGLFDKQLNLVAIAKLAQPVKSVNDAINFRIKWDW